MGPQKPAIRHHYVPEFILKRFCPGKKNQLWVFDKHTRRAFKTSVKNIACERFFNDFEIHGHKVTAEPSLADLETRTAPIVKRVIREGSIGSLALDDRIRLSYFIAVQLLRTRQQRNMFVDFHNSLKSWLEGVGADIKDIEGYVEPTENEIKKQGVLALKSAKELSVHVADKAWLLMKATKSAPFFISDHPVALQNQRLSWYDRGRFHPCLHRLTPIIT